MGRDPNGTFVTATAMPERVLFIEPLRRRMSVVLAGSYPEKLTIAIDGERLEPAPGQNVIAHGPDRNLSVDEIGGIELVGDAGAPGG